MALSEPIPALPVAPGGHRFVLYGDSCSGRPGTANAAAFARLNAMLARLEPRPDFVVFPGDEILGLSADPAPMRAEYAHWRRVEMAWAAGLPVYRTTGNHTAWDAPSAALHAACNADLPFGTTGPGPDYVVRRGDLALIAVHTLDAALGGEGHVDLDRLERALATVRDAARILVVGHHPAWPVQGRVGAHVRTLVEPEAFWGLLAAHGVAAYLCSHILCFDVQAHRGVLQITSGGAGTAQRLPGGDANLHAVQIALDDAGLRAAVHDVSGAVRTAFAWPPEVPGAATPLRDGVTRVDLRQGATVRFALAGRTATAGAGPRQTLLAVRGTGGLCHLWIGLVGRGQDLHLWLAPAVDRSPVLWRGPTLGAGRVFDLDLLVVPGMGAGGFLLRQSGAAWTSLAGTTDFGAERVVWDAQLWRGRAPGNPQPFTGRDLAVRYGS